MLGFVGRDRDLNILFNHLRWVIEGRGDQRGRAVLLRGRRRVGKSRLVDVFCERATVPYLVHQATRGQNPQAERVAFAQAVERSDLPDRESFEGIQLKNWEAAWRQLAASLPSDAPSIVVMDEFPWLLEQDPTAEGVLQTVWDRALSRKPVLLVIIGSDLAMMEQLSDYGRPFYQRGIEMTLAPLTPFDIQMLTGLSPAEAFDAHLITGGLPLLAQEWRTGWNRTTFLSHALQDPTSPLLVSGERTLSAEFPSAIQARSVLSVIGSGERSFSAIASRAGNYDAPLAPGSLNPALHTLQKKRLIAVDTPLSVKSGQRDRRYRIDDSYLRFWLRFLERSIPDVERGAGMRVANNIERSWAAWRGRAIEPLIRETIARIQIDVGAVGGWWPRTNTPEIDLVGADQSAPARSIEFVGSIKWRERAPFTDTDLRTLAADATHVPGASAATPLIGVSRSGFRVDGLSETYDPDELMQAWQV